MCQVLFFLGVFRNDLWIWKCRDIGFYVIDEFYWISLGLWWMNKAEFFFFSRVHVCIVSIVICSHFKGFLRILEPRKNFDFWLCPIFKLLHGSERIFEDVARLLTIFMHKGSSRQVNFQNFNLKLWLKIKLSFIDIFVSTLSNFLEKKLRIFFKFIAIWRGIQSN